MLKRFYLVGLLATLLGACDEEPPTTPDPLPPPPPERPVSGTISVVAGNQQVARRGSDIPVAPVVQVADQRGQPMQGITVTFSVIAGGGWLDSATAVTDATGKASVTGWTLGPSAGQNTIAASIAGSGNGATTIVAKARNPYWTILVYLAADNNLAPFAVADLDEMERAGSDSEVQIVVQGEFSSSDLARSPCPECAAPNTFRYAIGSLGDSRVGPDRPVDVIGSRDMTEAGTLRDFVAWGRQQYPAERYALVLWNHGGGYKGLIEDRTNAGAVRMTLTHLRQALTAVPPLDLIDFDMCLMGSADLLEMIRGTTGVVLFSQDAEPGPGNPYAEMIHAMRAAPETSTRGIATQWVEAFHTSYNDHRSQTTKSAFDMSEYESFSNAWEAVANKLTATMSSNRVLVGIASQRSQKFTFPQLKDLGNWTDSMAARSDDPELRSRLSALKAAATAPGFRIASRNRNGTDPSSPWVKRATGLSVLLPSGTAFDALPDVGPGSFHDYQQLLPNHPWTRMLASYLVGAPVKGYRDLAPNRYETYLVWDTAAVGRGVDVDFWVLEPDGNLYVPWLGVISANGALTGDSHDSDGYFEGYAMNQFVQAGRYKFFAHLYSDANSVGTRVDLVYRTNPAVDFTSLYSPRYPSLSRTAPISKDPTATFEKIESGLYPDVRYLAFWDIAPSGSPQTLSLSPSVGAVSGSERDLRTPTEITPDQMRTIVRSSMERKAGNPSVRPGDQQRPRRNSHLPGLPPVAVH